MDSVKAMARAQPVIGWALFAVTAVFGLLSLIFGWAIVRSLFTPCCALMGAQTGAILGWAIALQIGQKPLAPAIAGGLALVGAVFYGLVGWRAKPIGAYLLILSPFLTGTVQAAQLGMRNVGVLCLVIGFAIAFLAMRHIRPFMIVGTALVGTELVVVAGFLLWALAPVGPLNQAFTWVLNTALMPLLFSGLIFALGANMQFTMGPGDLTDEEKERWKKRHENP